MVASNEKLKGRVVRCSIEEHDVVESVKETPGDGADGDLGVPRAAAKPEPRLHSSDTVRMPIVPNPPTLESSRACLTGHTRPVMIREHHLHSDVVLNHTRGALRLVPIPSALFSPRGSSAWAMHPEWHVRTLDRLIQNLDLLRLWQIR